VSDCLFCRIAAGEIPATLVHQDEDVLAFGDIDPQAPTHILIIPRRHIGAMTEVTSSDETLLGHILGTATRVAADAGLDPDGYRLVINCGRNGGQAVDHLHLHLMGGRKMTWPPG